MKSTINGFTHIINKSRMFGDGITVVELNHALQNKSFIHIEYDDAAIMVHSPSFEDGMAQRLTGIFKCKVCDRIHLVCGYTSHRFNKRKQQLFNQEFFSEAENVFLNYVHDPSNFISRLQLIDFLETYPNQSAIISIQAVGEDKSFTLSEVLKCDNPKCACPHFGGGYELGAF